MLRFVECVFSVFMKIIFFQISFNKSVSFSLLQSIISGSETKLCIIFVMLNLKMQEPKRTVIICEVSAVNCLTT